MAPFYFFHLTGHGTLTDTVTVTDIGVGGEVVLLCRQHDFNVEHFLVECRRKVPLETLRDDLNTYLKILRSAMIELINKDYADFVNLSTNLVWIGSFGALDNSLYLCY